MKGLSEGPRTDHDHIRGQASRKEENDRSRPLTNGLIGQEAVRVIRLQRWPQITVMPRQKHTLLEIVRCSRSKNGRQRLYDSSRNYDIRLRKERTETLLTE